MSESKFFCSGKNDFCTDYMSKDACLHCGKMNGKGGEMRPVPDPPRLDRSAWEPCDFCEKELDEYPYIVAHSDYDESNTCYIPAFCPICGRPLTDAAWDMLDKKVVERWVKK